MSWRWRGFPLGKGDGDEGLSKITEAFQCLCLAILGLMFSPKAVGDVPPLSQSGSDALRPNVPGGLVT